MDTPDQKPSWVDQKIAEINTNLHFDFRSPLPPDQCIKHLEDEFWASPYWLHVTIEARDGDGFYFHIMEYNLIAVQIEGNVTSLGKGSLVDGRIIRPGCVLNILLLYGIIPLLIIGIGVFLWAIITGNTGLTSIAILLMVAGAFLGYVFTSYSRRYENYLHTLKTAIKTGKIKSSNKLSD